MTRQPYLHELVSCVRAPAAVLSGPDGQIRRDGAQGLLVGETRVLSRLELTVGSAAPVPVGYGLTGGAAATFTSVLRGLGDPGSDPTVRVVRERSVAADGFTERIALVNDSHVDVDTVVELRAECDFAGIGAVRDGAAGEPATPAATGATVGWAPVDWAPVDWAPVGWATIDWAPLHPNPAGRTVRLTAQPPAGDARALPDGVLLTWDVHVPARGTWRLVLRTAAGGAPPPFPAPSTPCPVAGLAVRCADAELGRLVEQGIADLDALRLADPLRPADEFYAAGSPWYFTLFGRDSLWTARMLLPADTTVAAGTLRTLARRQGRTTDPATGEEPGKIMHEQREAGIGSLPPLYYGTIDATSLWVILLHDAWRWGLPAAEVVELLGPLRAALGWITSHDGFLAYRDPTGTGLANQGWKDSEDGVQWPDGRLAEPPIALCEAQAYAHEAAVAGAALLAAFPDADAPDAPGRPTATAGPTGATADATAPTGPAAEGGDEVARCLAWAAALRDRFRERFWVADEHGPFPAIAIDAAGRPVGGATSNLGHLLGTGLLDAGESALVARRLATADLDGGHGLRTMSTRTAGFNPLGYHTGSVWPHDTAIAVAGLARAGHGEVAASLARGLVRAAGAFRHRLPELYAGTAAGEPVLAYPPACRPQAWSAAAAVALIPAALGLAVDVPAGTLRVEPDPAFASWFPMQVSGLRIGSHELRVAVDADGTATVDTTARLTVDGAFG